MDACTHATSVYRLFRYFIHRRPCDALVNWFTTYLYVANFNIGIYSESKYIYYEVHSVWDSRELSSGLSSFLLGIFDKSEGPEQRTSSSPRTKKISVLMNFFAIRIYVWTKAYIPMNMHIFWLHYFLLENTWMENSNLFGGFRRSEKKSTMHSWRRKYTTFTSYSVSFFFLRQFVGALFFHLVFFSFHIHASYIYRG